MSKPTSLIGLTKEEMDLIRGFMGKDFHKGKLISCIDWNILMPVVEKIESLWISATQPRFKIYGTFVEVVHKSALNIHFARNSNKPKDDQLEGALYPNKNSKIDNVYEMVIQFIQWYNTQPK